MTERNIEAEVMGVLSVAFAPVRAVTPEITLDELGIGVWDILEMTLLLEEKFGEKYFWGFEPTPDMTVRALALDIKRRMK